MNPLQAIPARVRRWIYIAWFVAGLGLGATQVGYATAGTGQPSWLMVAFAVFGYLGVGLGITAASNTADASIVAVTAPATIEVSADEHDAEPGE